MKKTLLFASLLLLFSVSCSDDGGKEIVKPEVVKPEKKFTQGNLVIQKLLVNLNLPTNSDYSAAPIFLDEFKIEDGGDISLVNTYPMPVKSEGENHRITAIPRSSFSGCMTLSNDGQYLVFYGYDAERGQSLQTINTSITPLVYARVGANGVADTKTTSTLYNSEIKGVSSYDGSGFYIAGNGSATGLGLDYVAYNGETQLSLMSSTDQTTIGGPRTTFYQFDKLYLISWAHTFAVENSSLPPTTESTFSNVISRPAEGGTSYSSYIVDMDPANAGTKLVMYQPNDQMGVFKYSLIDGVWKSNGKCLITLASKSTLLKSIVGRVVNGKVELFLVENHQWGGRLLSIVDDKGFDGAIDDSIDTSLRVLRDYDGSAYAIRSVAWAPVEK